MTEYNSPTVVLLDIETSPITAYTWQTYDTNVLKVLEPSKIISVAWKELGAEETHVKCIADYKSYRPGKVEDEDLIVEIWNVLDKADIVIAHHGDAFDIKKLNSRFVFHGLNAPSYYKTIDTKKVASKYFSFDSNSLNNLGVYLKEGEKISNGGFDLWVKCISGDPEAWAKMKAYNKQDVILLEKVYLRLRPFMSDHPNMNMIGETEGKVQGQSCSTCLSSHVVKRGFAYTQTGRKQRYQCQDCHSWSSGSYERVK